MWVGAYGWQSRVAGADSVYGRVAKAYAAREKAILDPTKLIVVDEADRLQMASLEQLRAIFDESDLGLILIGMPGLEKRLARYPQFYSRIGFVHEFRPLSHSEMRQLLLQRWMPPDLALLKVAKIDPDAIATIIRVTNGNFRLLHRLLTQIRKNPRDQFTYCTDEGGRRGSAGDVGNRPSLKLFRHAAYPLMRKIIRKITRKINCQFPAIVYDLSTVRQLTRSSWLD